MVEVRETNFFLAKRWLWADIHFFLRKGWLSGEMPIIS